ncbi:O-antigen ligase family protein [Chitinophaga oryziterrae]|nr:O-antigen ligase family protein [Chitinophaga oryziterrae]
MSASDFRVQQRYVKCFGFHKRVLSFLALLFNCLLFSYCVFGYKYSANLELDVTGYYLLVPVCLVVFLFFFSMNVFFDWVNFTDFKIGCVLLIGLLCLAYYCDVGFFSLGHEQVLCLFSFLVAAYVFLFHLSILEFDAFFNFVNLVTLLQLVKACTQVRFGSFDPLAVVGYFGNSGALSVYLVVAYPLLFLGFARFGGIWKRLLGAVVVLVLAGVLCLTLSRTSILCFVLENVVLVFGLFGERFLSWYRRFKGLFVFVVLVFLGVVFFLFRFLFLVKLRSAQGRLLIWEVCWSWIKQSPLFGYGFGSFAFQYPLWQSDYFASHGRVPTAYFLSAGETMVAFNEYVQVWCESGMIGLVVLLLLLGAGFCADFTFVGRKRLLYVKVFLLGCCCSAFSFYTFHCTAVGYLFVVILFSLVYRPRKDTFRVMAFAVRWPLYVVVALVVLLSVYRSGVRAYAMDEFNVLCLKHDLSEGELQHVERDIYPVLASDGKFLTRLGILMVEYSHRDRAVNYLELSKVYYSGYENYFELARCYGQDVNALRAYRFLSFYIPSKFAPKFGLFSVYRALGDVADADRMARYIMAMPVKLHSTAVMDIKRDVQLYLDGKN